MRQMIWMLLAVSCVAGCAAPPSVNIEQEREKLMVLDREWSQSAKDMDKFLSYYAPDASLYPPGMPIATGPANIRSVFATLTSMPGFALQFAPTKADVSTSGDLAYISGTYELTLNGPSGQPMTEKGKYIEVWKKQPDGQWKVVADIFNADSMPPPPTMAAPPPK